MQEYSIIRAITDIVHEHISPDISAWGYPNGTVVFVLNGIIIGKISDQKIEKPQEFIQNKVKEIKAALRTIPKLKIGDYNNIISQSHKLKAGMSI